MSNARNERAAHAALSNTAQMRGIDAIYDKQGVVIERYPSQHVAVLVMTPHDLKYRAIEARAIHVCGLAGITLTLPGERS
jgi:hypothetical protein